MIHLRVHIPEKDGVLYLGLNSAIEIFIRNNFTLLLLLRKFVSKNILFLLARPLRFLVLLSVRWIFSLFESQLRYRPASSRHSDSISTETFEETIFLLQPKKLHLFLCWISDIIGIVPEESRLYGWLAWKLLEEFLQATLSQAIQRIFRVRRANH